MFLYVFLDSGSFLVTGTAILLAPPPPKKKEGLISKPTLAFFTLYLLAHKAVSLAIYGHGWN